MEGCLAVYLEAHAHGQSNLMFRKGQDSLVGCYDEPCATINALFSSPICKLTYLAALFVPLTLETVAYD